MHAFLLTGSTTDDFESEIVTLSKKLSADVLPVNLKKISDARDLGKMMSLARTGATLIVAKNIDDSTTETLNAFLKNLENPPETIFFALTCRNLKNVLPTIVSRCQIIKVTNQNTQISESDKLNLERFLTMTTTQRLSFFDTIKDRGEATHFVESLIFFLHRKKNLKNMELLTKTLTRLKANGTLNLHLTNLCINLI